MSMYSSEEAEVQEAASLLPGSARRVPSQYTPFLFLRAEQTAGLPAGQAGMRSVMQTYSP